MILEIVVALIAVSVIYFYRSCTKRYGYLESLGIPVEKPFLCFGTGPFSYHKVNFNDVDMERSKKNGGQKTWGTYEGSQPTINTVDTELIKEIFIKRFDHFHERFDAKLKDELRTVDMMGGEEWKYVRKSLSPVFTSGKIKGMIDPIHEVVEKLLTYIDHQHSLAGNDYQ